MAISETLTLSPGDTGDQTDFVELRFERRDGKIHVQMADDQLALRRSLTAADKQRLIEWLRWA